MLPGENETPSHQFSVRLADLEATRGTDGKKTKLDFKKFPQTQWEYFLVAVIFLDYCHGALIIRCAGLCF